MPSKDDDTTMDRQRSIILFDGVCNLCNGFVQFIIRRDHRARFHFGTLQSEQGKVLLAGSSSLHEELETVVYIRDRSTLTRSSAALYILKDLGGIWSLAYAFMIVPRPVRDAVYRFVSRYRYSWFGRRPQCMIPTPDIAKRFISGPTEGR